MDFQNDSELLSYAKKLEGKRICDICEDDNRMLTAKPKSTKAVIANIIETKYFGISTNSDQAPDFKDLNIELKVSPLKPIFKGTLLSAKERSVIGMVDYWNVLDKPCWRDNHRLSHKLQKILFIFYIHDKARPAREWRFACAFIWSPNQEQDAQIQKDYDIISCKVVKGQPNSEKDNCFLATCPKHEGGFIAEDPPRSNRNSLCDHPVMGVAERRGFCIRNKSVVEIIASSLGLRTVKKGNSLAIPISEFKALR
jgi:DNA mismatch repair protein MutH